jgi:cytochrome P450
MVVKEVLRVYTIGLAGMRDATQDDTLPDGTFIPKGTEVIVFMKIMHNLEEYWGKDADQFNPDRWNDIHPEKIPNFIHVFMPFLCGARICIGQRLALMEFKMALMLLVSEFEFSQVAGHVVKGSVGVSNKPDPHILLNVKAL